MGTLIEKTTQQTNESAALTFKDRAIPIAKMGVPVIRLHPKDKKPRDKEWQNLATTDLTQIVSWDKETPDANCGSVAKSDGFLFFESDEKGVIARYQKETGESFQTFTVQSRPGRFHFYFKQSDLTRKIGSITQKELGFGSLRQHNAFVVSPNSVHPETGTLYTVVRNAPIVSAPNRFIEWLVAQKGEEQKQAVQETGEKITQGGRNVELTRLAGKLRRDGLEQEELEMVLHSYNLKNCVPPLPEKEVKMIAWSIGKKEAGPIGPTITIGGAEPGARVIPSAEQIEKQKALQELVDSTPNSREEAASFADSLYPYWAYNGTLYEDFANFCGRGNLIPKEFFIEAAKAMIGAVCGHRFSPQEGRFYTFILTKIGGIGKGTAFDALRNLFAGTGLLYGMGQDGSGAFINIGCAEGNFSSSSGMHGNGFARHNRIVQIYDELTKLLEKFSIPGSGDSFLDDLNTLFEANAYIPSLTKGSKVAGGVSGTQHNSILGGTTFDKWNSAFGKTTAEGSGFFQRLNLVSSDETETVAEIPKLDFTDGDGLELRQKFLVKIMPLEYQTVVFEKTAEAEKRFNEWHAAFKKEHHDEPAEVTGRLNVMVSRNYEHLAFMLAPTVAPNPEKANEPIRIVCDLPTMEKAIALADYQYQVRAKHRPAQGANESALIEDSIRLTLLSSERNSLSRSDLYKKSGSRKYGLLVFDRVLNALNNEGLVEIRTKSNNTTRGRKGEVVVWIGE
jgi:bifunctional DNA primase/polymerase-like protein/primase-like protein